MRIGLDISPLGSAHNTRGTGSYTRLLIEALYAHGSAHTVVSFHSSEGLPRDVDIYHFPYFDPFFLTLPPVRQCPTIVTVHDLIPIAYPRHFPKGLRGSVKWHIQKRRLRGVDAILTDSEASKKDILSYTDCKESAIHVVPLAAPAEYAPVTDSQVLNDLRRKYHLPERFFLYVGDINWNKNIPGLIRGYALARKQAASATVGFPELVLVGKAFTHTWLPELKSIQSAIVDEDVKTNVRILGFLSAGELPAMYSLATCYTQVSFAEGFGLPVLEAMACGCPTVVSGVSSLAEIAGPSVTVNPESTQSIAEGLLRMVQSTDTKRRDSFIRWSKRYTWKKTAEETVRVYETVFT